MMYLGDQAVGLNTQFGYPSFFNHIESGTFINDQNTYSLEIPLQQIQHVPKGVLVYSNAFDTDSDKTDKPSLGPYAALFIAGTGEIPLSSDNVYYLTAYSGYYVNWGGDSNQKSPTKRDSRLESRGLHYFRPSNNSFAIRGFGTGDYDFKYNIPYHWIAWD